MQLALTGITDAYGKGPTHGDRMRATAKVANVMLRTWSGLMCMCRNDMAAIRTIVNVLRLPSMDTRVSVQLCVDVVKELPTLFG